MPPQVSTLNSDTESLSDREFLERLAGDVESLKKNVRLLLDHQEINGKQLDHIDLMSHEVWQFIEEHRPALAKALAFLSPGRSLSDYFKRGGQRERDDH